MNNFTGLLEIEGDFEKSYVQGVGRLIVMIEANDTFIQKHSPVIINSVNTITMDLIHLSRSCPVGLPPLPHFAHRRRPLTQ